MNGGDEKTSKTLVLRTAILMMRVVIIFLFSQKGLKTKSIVLSHCDLLVNFKDLRICILSNRTHPNCMVYVHCTIKALRNTVLDSSLSVEATCLSQSEAAVNSPLSGPS